MANKLVLLGLLYVLYFVNGDQMEGHKCDLNKDDNIYGQCADTLICMPADNEKYGICQCVNQDVVCGTNGKTYINLCRMLEDAIRLGIKDLEVAHPGKCEPQIEETAPVISSRPPDNVRNTTGGCIAIGCEAYGNPIPDIAWRFRPLNGREKSLPGDDQRISTNTRGGPEANQLTGWLQIMDLDESHEGDYICIASSTLGSDKAQARVKVFPEEDLVRVKRKDL